MLDLRPTYPKPVVKKPARNRNLHRKKKSGEPNGRFASQKKIGNGSWVGAAESRGWRRRVRSNQAGVWNIIPYPGYRIALTYIYYYLEIQGICKSTNPCVLVALLSGMTT
jgi:hypothetical protein